MSNKLTNTQILVIGGSSGIGLATAVSAAERSRDQGIPDSLK
jgi:NAD(P)-dependent dehydrogenase (short-subunit alcohol dehydrogenase family)